MPDADGGASASTKDAKDDTATAGSVSDRFPALKQLEEDVERAKLEQALAEARTATGKAKLPSLDVSLTPDTVATSDKTTGLARVLVQSAAVTLADDIADICLDAASRVTPASGGRRSYIFRVVSDAAAPVAVDVYRLLD